MKLNNIKASKVLFLLFVSVIFFSCTPRKKLLYLSTGSSQGNTSISKGLDNYLLHEGDMLFVKVQTMDDKTFKLFNSEWQNVSAKTDISLFIDSYTVSDSGYIELPITGKINVKGLTLMQAKQEIQGKINSYLLEANVMIKLLNYKVTILGEVARPGTFKIYDNSINVLEAISMAGDLTVFGNRKNILVLRKSEDNKMEYLDITDINVVNSEFFYLKPNDVIYIQPNVSKSLGFKEFPFAILFSGITTVLVLINFLSK